MPRYKFIVLSKPQDGREAEYNEWYQDIHLKQVAALPGVKSAQRYKLAQAFAPPPNFPYLAIYEIEADDLAAFSSEMLKRAGTELLPVSDALDTDSAYAVVYEEFGAAVKP